MCGPLRRSFRQNLLDYPDDDEYRLELKLISRAVATYEVCDSWELKGMGEGALRRVGSCACTILVS